MLWSHLTVVVIGVGVLVIAGRQLGEAFVNDHLSAMGPMMGGQANAMEAAEFEAGVRSSFNRALWWGAGVSAVAAAGAALFAARRLLIPVEEVRTMTRRLAAGAYHERIPLPREAELAALAADVNSLASALDQTEQRRLRLVGEVAHELRTPVATLKGYLEGLLDGVFELDEEILAASIVEATRLERLAADLSILSRVEEGRIDLQTEPCDLRDLITHVTGRLASQFVDNEVSLVVDDLPPLATFVDRDRVIQVLTNIIGNALAYTGPGGSVRITATATANQRVVTVTDTGRGLTNEQLELVFERFYRADRSATGGSGIGLTIARTLARHHGGDLTATSDGLGHGAAFILSLPEVSKGSESSIALDSR
ncbi:MAG: HAMP domain-containing protein [Acidimicrobiia bacterium]|nr:HAMP domain-containing protein [Acidimicrobiia bacterium]